MYNVNDIYSYMCELAPLTLKIDRDNVGLLVGNSKATVSRVTVALDATPEVIEEAINSGSELIVTHHPVIFGSITNVTDLDQTGQKLLQLLSQGISVISMHTNLDVVAGGVNDILAKTVGLTNIEVLHDPSLSADPGLGVCRVGVLPNPTEIKTFARAVKESLGANGLWYTVSSGTASKVAVGGGSCGSYIRDVVNAGCDTFITSDIKHSQILEAQQLGRSLIDAGHFSTEDVVCPAIVEALQKKFAGLYVNKSQALVCPKKFIAD